MAWAGMPSYAPHGHAMRPCWQGTSRDGIRPRRHDANSPLPVRGEATATSSKQTLACPLYSPRQRIRAHLEVHDLRRVLLAAFQVERRAVAGVRPDAAAFPAGIRIVDPAIEALRPEAHRIGHDHVDQLAILEGDQRRILIAGGNGHVLAEAERVVLVDPGVVGRFAAAVGGDVAE